MYYSERQAQILALLEKEKSISVHRLAKLLSISESSVRRDLAIRTVLPLTAVQGR